MVTMVLLRGILGVETIDHTPPLGPRPSKISRNYLGI